MLKELRNQILRHSLDCNALRMIQSTFVRFSGFLQIKEWGPNFWAKQFCRQSEFLGPLCSVSNLKISRIQILRR